MRLASSLIPAALTLTALASLGSSATATPTVTAVGVDDYNTSTLSPYDATTGAVILNNMVGWFANALPNSASNNGQFAASFGAAAQWTFTMASLNNQVDVPSLDSFNYSAFVVTNDPYNLPNGAAAAVYGYLGDAGGANYSLNYEPNNCGTPSDCPGGQGSAIALANVHFFQIVQVVTYYGNDQTGVVNGALTTTQDFVDVSNASPNPFYDTGGAHGSAGVNSDQYWMDDTPYRCENQSGAGGCAADGGANTNLLEVDWQAATYIAVDNGAGNGTQHQVTLYGGVNWGFEYSNEDTPEPAAFAIAGLGLALLVAGKRRWQKR